MSLGTGKAQPPFGRSRAASRAMAVTAATRAQDLRAFLTWAVSSGTAQLATVNFQPLPPSIMTLSDAQIARIKG